MRGHTQIIEMRLQRKCPRWVFVNDYPCKTDWFDTGDHATVCTAGDSLASLDLRFLVGLSVSISACTEERAKALFGLACKAGARVVAACHMKPGKTMAERASGWSQIFHAEEDQA